VSQHGRHTIQAERPRRTDKPDSPKPVAPPPAPKVAARPAPAPRKSAAATTRRRGPISLESALVVTLIGIIAGASALVNQIDPGTQRTQTTVGATQFKTHQLGQGGIQPGVIQPRTIIPVHEAASDQLSGVTPAPAPKPVATKGPKPTVAPTAPAAGTIGTGSGTGGGTTSPGTGPGGTGGGTGSGSCSPLGGLLGGCQTKPTVTGPQTGATTPLGQ
jgi:hypothetical protein